jgi:hypothetical protein
VISMRAMYSGGPGFDFRFERPVVKPKLFVFPT